MVREGARWVVWGGERVVLAEGQRCKGLVLRPPGTIAEPKPLSLLVSVPSPLRLLMLGQPLGNY